MAGFTINLPPGNEYGSRFELRVACSSLDGSKMLPAEKLQTVTIQDGTVLDTADPHTAAIMEALCIPGMIGTGVVVSKLKDDVVPDAHWLEVDPPPDDKPADDAKLADAMAALAEGRSR